MWQESCLRIMDANYNRGKEALRVCEEILRFVFENRNLSRRCKLPRHQLSQIFLKLPTPYAKIVHARNTVQDVGREFSVSDKKKPMPTDILAANMKRAEEAVRVLEEMTRVIAPKKVLLFERLRFAIYGLEKKVFAKF